MHFWNYLLGAICLAAVSGCSSDSTSSGAGGSAGTGGTTGTGGSTGTGGAETGGSTGTGGGDTGGSTGTGGGETGGSSGTGGDVAGDGGETGGASSGDAGDADYATCVEGAMPSDTWTPCACAVCAKELNACWGDTACGAADEQFSLCAYPPDGGPDVDNSKTCEPAAKAAGGELWQKQYDCVNAKATSCQ
jgi:hypothetical protein